MAIWRWSLSSMSWILVAGEFGNSLPDRVPFCDKYWCVIDDDHGICITYISGLPLE